LHCLEVEVKERLHFRLWLHGHDLFAFYPYLFKEAAAEPIPLVLVRVSPTIGNAGQELRQSI
jgi:hypothetical protein